MMHVIYVVYAIHIVRVIVNCIGSIFIAAFYMDAVSKYSQQL